MTEARWDVLAAACPTRQVVGRIGDKWRLLTLYALDTGTLRFSALPGADRGREPEDAHPDVARTGA